MSLWEIQQYILLIPLLLVFSVGIFTLFRCRSEKKNFFILVAFAAFIHILGHLFGVLSANTGEVFASIRLINLGSGMCMLFFVFFIADYCEIKIHSAIKALLSVFMALYVVGVWTTDSTGFYYASYELIPDISNQLVFTQGSLSYLFTGFFVIYFAIAVVIIIRKTIYSFGDYRKTLILATLAFLCPFASKLFDLPLSMDSFLLPFPATPYAYGISAIICYIAIIKYDALDRSPIASLQAMNTISQAIIILDEDLHYISANGAAHTLFPWLKAYKTGEAIYYSPHWPSELSHTAFANDEFSVDFATPDSLHHYHATAHPFHSDFSRKKHWSVMIQDVTDSENFVKQLEEAAYTDTLTGLYNRRHFSEIAMPFIERTKRSGAPYYIMMADLDFFKKINDDHGHLAGDAVLRHVSTIMKNIVRAYDIVARWGGEEFIFLITASGIDDVRALAERILYAIEHTACDYNGKKLPITISFGIAQSKDKETDMTDLILRADEALYRSKQNGRNCITVWDGNE